MEKEEIYSLWFQNSKEWFKPSSEFDKKISEFKSYLDLYPLGLLNFWKETPKGILSLIILLDQFPRHIFRGYPESYSYDNDARHIVSTHLNLLDNFHGYEKVFFLMPYQHSEDLVIQEVNVNLWKTIIFKESNLDNLKIYQKALINAEKHYQVIKKFGRFPKRNQILNRENTVEEKKYLSENQFGFI